MRINGLTLKDTEDPAKWRKKSRERTLGIKAERSYATGV